MHFRSLVKDFATCVLLYFIFSTLSALSLGEFAHFTAVVYDLCVITALVVLSHINTPLIRRHNVIY